MGTKHIHNPGPNTMFVAGRMIAPGEGRDFDERDLPGELRDAPPAPAPEAPEGPSVDEQLEPVLAQSVKEITSLLGSMTHEALDRLADMERGREHPRKTLLEAIADEAIRRANERLESDDLASGEGGA